MRANVKTAFLSQSSFFGVACLSFPTSTCVHIMFPPCGCHTKRQRCHTTATFADALCTRLA